MVSSRKRMNFRQAGSGFSSTEDRRSRAHFDWILFVIVYALAIFGVYCISIATFNPDNGTDLSLLNYILNSRSASWQAIFCLASPVIIFFIYAIPYELLRVQGRLVYLGICALLLIAFGTEAIGGVTAWIPIGKGRTIQPAEFIKVGIILMMARCLSSVEKPFCSLKNTFQIFLIFGAPAFLTLASGELGSVLVMCVVFYVMLYFGNTDGLILITILVVAVLAVGGILGFALVSGSESYRLARILSFLDPEAYASDAAYQLLNSQLAIGSGGVDGIGTYVVGSISQLNYVPEDWTDFIFSGVGEAFGFIGCILLLFAYVLLLLRLLYLAHYTQDEYGRLIIVGVMAMFFGHIFENIGMCIGVLPITGIPLPFISYGGSNFVTNMAAIGLVLNVVKNRSSAVAINTPYLMHQTRKRSFFRKGKHAK